MDSMHLRFSDVYEGDKPYIFISYSHKDQQALCSVKNILKENNVRYWYDDGLSSGDDWNLIIAEHLKNASACLLLLSPNSVASENVKDEIVFAKNYKILIQLLAVESFVPPLDIEMMLGRKHRIEFEKAHPEKIIENLPAEVFAEQQEDECVFVDDNDKTNEQNLIFQQYKEIPPIINKNKNVQNILCAGTFYTIGLKNDGKVISTMEPLDYWLDESEEFYEENYVYGWYREYNVCGRYDIDDWEDIVAISSGDKHTVGLKSDGSVVAVGDNKMNQCCVSEWADIIAVAAGGNHTVGLKSDGTVIAVGSNNYCQCNVSSWKDIVAVSAGGCHTVGLKSDGSVIAVGDNSSYQCSVSRWRDIIAVAAGVDNTVGLKSNGTVVIAGNEDGKNAICWRDIVAVSAGGCHTVGLKSDGTVVVALGTGAFSLNKLKGIGDWTDIVAVSAGADHIVGLKSDGSVVAVGDDENYQCDVKNWKLF